MDPFIQYIGDHIDINYLKSILKSDNKDLTIRFSKLDVEIPSWYKKFCILAYDEKIFRYLYKWIRVPELTHCNLFWLTINDFDIDDSKISKANLSEEDWMNIAMMYRVLDDLPKIKINCDSPSAAIAAVMFNNIEDLYLEIRFYNPIGNKDLEKALEIVYERIKDPDLIAQFISNNLLFSVADSILLANAKNKSLENYPEMLEMSMGNYSKKFKNIVVDTFRSLLEGKFIGKCLISTNVSCKVLWLKPNTYSISYGKLWY